jgi:hypothetical protein
LRRPVEPAGVERTLRERLATSEIDPIRTFGRSVWSRLFDPSHSPLHHKVLGFAFRGTNETARVHDRVRRRYDSVAACRSRTAEVDAGDRLPWHRAQFARPGRVQPRSARSRLHRGSQHPDRVSLGGRKTGTVSRSRGRTGCTQGRCHHEHRRYSRRSRCQASDDECSYCFRCCWRSGSGGGLSPSWRGRAGTSQGCPTSPTIWSASG